MHLVTVEDRVGGSLTTLHAAVTLLHDHHVLLDGVAVGTLELEQLGLGLLGSAALSLLALSALLERNGVGFAALVRQSLVHLHCSGTAFPFLWTQKRDNVKSLLFDDDVMCYI